MPLDDPELYEALGDAIEDELRRVDLARLLLIHNSPPPFRHPSATRSTVRRAA